MGNKGTAISLISPKQKYILQNFAKTKLANIKLSELPSESDMKFKQQKRFADSINNEPIHLEADALLADLQKEYDLKDITLKLISRYLKKESIGSAKMVSSPKEDKESSGSSNRRRSGGFRGDGPRKGGRGGKPPFKKSFRR